MVELNEFLNLAKVSVIHEAWKEGSYPIVYGWVFDMESGLIKDLNVRIDEADDIDYIYKFEF